MGGMPKLSASRILKGLALVAVIGAGIWLGRLVERDDVAQAFVSDLGYLGIVLVAYGSGFNLIVPIPAATFVPAFVSAGFPFWTVIIVMTFGLTAADMTAYLIGRAGKHVAEKPPKGFLKRIDDYQKTHPRGRWVVLFLFAAFIPLPNEVLVLPMGYLGARARDIVLPVFFGNFLFNAVASGGIFAIAALL